jgi:lipid-A-disaccharide synthase
MVVAYRFNALNYQIARLFIKVAYFALPNLLLNKPVVPEFFQNEATPERLGAALLEQLDRGKDIVLLDDFKYLREMLAQSADEEAAKAVLSLCGAKR